MNHKTSIPAIIATSLLGAGCAALILYCERLQLLPLTAPGLALRLGLGALCGAALFAVLFLILSKALRGAGKAEWIPILLTALAASVCVLIWFPIPDTGFFPRHSLEIRALPDENGITRPVTLTWLRLENRDVPLNDVRCEGDCPPGENRPELRNGNAVLRWEGKTGNLITIEFVSGPEQGIASIRWDGIDEIHPLNNPEMERLSFQHTFPTSHGMPEFMAAALICFTLCLTLTAAAVRLMPKWDFRAFGIAAFLVFCAVRILQVSGIGEPLIFIDSGAYLGLSKMSLSDIFGGTKFCHIEGWHCVSRPVLVPLVYKLLGQDLKLITIFQLTVSILCWGFFASRAALTFRKDLLRKLALLLSLGLGCVPNVSRWDGMIMSESISISTAMLFMGSLLWLTRPDEENRWRPLPAVFSLISALLFSLTRDSAVWCVGLVLILLLCIVHLRSQRIFPLLLCAGLAVICLVLLTGTGDRWVYSFENVLFNRILRDPQGQSFLAEAGMPFPAGIEQFYGTQHVMASPVFNSDEFAPLREWILSDGLKTYVRWLLRDPVYALRITWDGGFEKEAFETVSYTFTPSGFRALLPNPLIKFFSCNLPGAMVLLIACAGLFAAFRVPEGIRFAFPLLFILAAYPLSTAAYLADEYELDRHIIVNVIMMKAGLWTVLCLLLEQTEKIKDKK